MRVLLEQLSPEDEGARQVRTELLETWHGKLAAGVRHMQEQGLMRPAPDADRAAAGLLAAVQGGAVHMIVTGRLDALEAALDLTLGQLRADA
jgi:hypothetical protein